MIPRRFSAAIAALTLRTVSDVPAASVASPGNANPSLSAYEATATIRSRSLRSSPATRATSRAAWSPTCRSPELPRDTVDPRHPLQHVDVEDVLVRPRA